MRPLVVARNIIGLAAIVVIAVIVLSPGSYYHLRLVLDNAAGLRLGSGVHVGGIQVGTVSSERIGRNDKVVVNLAIDPSRAPVGRNATAAIESVNLLGQKFVQLTKGNLADPAPSGYTLPFAQVSTSTDLDQVLDVLDPTTRDRLGVFINEAGLALSGRRQDFSSLLLHLPHSLTDLTSVLQSVGQDNQALGALIDSSDGFITKMAGQRAQLTAALHSVSAMARSVGSRRAQLLQTLQRAPGALATLQSFLAQLQATTAPLGPAAVNLTETARPLRDTLAEVHPFTTAATPLFRQATSVAEPLVTLADGATPVIRRAVPTSHALQRFSTSFNPAGDVLNHSVDNLIAIMDNWSHALVGRDALSHVFRAEAVFTDNQVEEMVSRLLGHEVFPSKAKRVHHSAPVHRSTPAPAPAPRSAAPTAPVPASPPARSTPTIVGTVQGVTSGLTSAAGGAAAALGGLVNRVLHGGGGDQTGTTGASGSSGASGASGLGKLLGYLLAP